MKRSGLGPGDALAVGRLGGGDGPGLRAGAAAAAPSAEGARSLRPCASPGGGAAVSVRGPCARPHARTPALGGLGPRGLRARPAAKARVIPSRSAREAWDLRGREGDLCGEGSLKAKGQTPGSQLPKAKARYGGRRPAAPSRLSVPAPSVFCPLTLDSQLSLLGLNVFIFEMGCLDSLFFCPKLLGTAAPLICCTCRVTNQGS